MPTMQEKYTPADIERAAQQHWDNSGAARAIEDLSGQNAKPKYYCLSFAASRRHRPPRPE